MVMAACVARARTCAIIFEQRENAMRRLLMLLSAAAIALMTASSHAKAQVAAELSTPPNGDNLSAEISQWNGPVKVTIAYHSPRVHFRDRARTGHIWGELIHYGLFDDGFGPSRATPWRAGANESTIITLSHDVR